MNDTKQIENYLKKQLTPEDLLLMEAQMLLNHDLRENVFWQEKTYQLIKDHGRKRLKAEIELLSAKLFSESKFKNFREKVFTIFKSNT